MVWISLIVATLFLRLIYLVWQYFNTTIDVTGKAVFISGCDSGIGYLLAMKLDHLGMKVYAGCLTSQGADFLASVASSSLFPILCDITKEEDVSNAVRIVAERSPEGLFAIINNAGIMCIGEWDWVPSKFLRQVMEVNFFGHVNVTKAFLPQLKKTKGRIVNITSIAGTMAPEFLGAYACSKYAMEAFSDSLRREMGKWGVSVYVIEPCSTNTPMVQSRIQLIERIWDQADEKIKQEYGEEYIHELKNPMHSLVSESPKRVVDAVVGKLALARPTLRSQIGRMTYTSATLLFQLLPTRLSDIMMSLAVRHPIPAVLRDAK